MSLENSSPFDVVACSNVNSAWGALAMEVLARLGVQTVVISPGSRSTSLTIAAARNPKLEAIPVLDERTAGFFALGMAKRTHKPVVLVCTSGSAGANYLPAIVEASMSATPLLVLTADRPPELRDCASGQTIDQLTLYGDYVRSFTECALPEVNPEMLAYLRQTLVHAVNRSLVGEPGPVHMNFPFRDPLHPTVDCEPALDVATLEVAATVQTRRCEAVPFAGGIDSIAVERLSSHRKGLIIVGDVNPEDGDESFADAVAMLSEKLGWPVLGDVLNPLRGHACETRALITRYDAILRDATNTTELEPTAVLQIGSLPTSKVLRKWLSQLDAVAFLLSEYPANTDPLHRVATPLVGTAHALAEVVGHLKPEEGWVETWVAREWHVTGRIDDALADTNTLFEGKAAWLLSQKLPVGSSVFLASSMSVRYAEWFWSAGSRACSIFSNRGANGIDGTLGTALGVAHGGKPAVLLTGDLAFLHDSNALLAAKDLNGSLTVICINNNGGGIFEHLPVAEVSPEFEDYFVTPQKVDIAQLCAAYDISHTCIHDWDTFSDAVSSLPECGVRVLELQTDRKADRATLKQLLA